MRFELPKINRSTPNRLITVGLVTILATQSMSCGKGRSIPGLEKFSTSVIQGRLYVSFLSTSLQWDLGLSMPIPGLEDSSISMSPDLSSDGTIFQISVGLASLLNDGRYYPSSGLPDGRPLPEVVNGALPRWDAEVGKLTLSVYLSNDAFGLFIPLSFLDKNGAALPVMISAKITDDRGNLLGKIFAIPSSAVRNVSGSGSGLFILIPFLGLAPNGTSLQ